MIAAVTENLRARSGAAAIRMEASLPRLMRAWLALIVLACGLRIATSPVDGGLAPSSLAAFLLLAAAPIVSGAMALRWFADPEPPAPTSSPAWRALAPAEARRHPLHGPGGIMVSLMGGLLLAILLRALEYLTALPALPEGVPSWLAALQLALTADVVLMTSLYAVAFVAALRRAPLFPPLLAAIWALDLAMQMTIRAAVVGQPDVPPAVGEALAAMLGGNIDKVLLSAALWAPYLLLSKRVNVTFRHRLPR